MKEINAYQLQQQFKRITHISTAWIQLELHVGYRAAREILEELIARGWVSPEYSGSDYPVLHENLRLRRIERYEVDGLIDLIDYDCVAALKCIEKFGGATYGELEEAVKDEEDTDDAIATLDGNGLIYKYGDKYYSCVSRRTVEVLSTVVRTKRDMEMKKRFGGVDADPNELKALFDELFFEE